MTFKGSPAEGISVPAPCEPGRTDSKGRSELSSGDRRILQAAADISQTSVLDDDAIGFLPAVLCSVGLPRRRVDGTSFARTNGKASLVITAGSLWNGSDWCQQPVPYGPMPRLMLAEICTKAVQKNTREIDIGRSAADFLTRIGKKRTGGQKANPKTGAPARGAHAALHLQANALAACSLSLGFEGKKGPVTESTKLVSRFEAWRRSSDYQLELWSPILHLSAEFAASLVAHAVPFDMRAVAALNRWSLAMDAYLWLSYRLCQLKRPVPISWHALKAQFGQEYCDPREFNRDFKLALRRACAVYPNAKIEIEIDELKISPSRPPVPPRAAVQVPATWPGSVEKPVQ